MTRRGFLGGLMAAGAALSADPEKLLWKRGERLISIPTPSLYVAGSDLRGSSLVLAGSQIDSLVAFGSVLTVEGVRKVNPLTGASFNMSRPTLKKIPHPRQQYFVIGVYRSLDGQATVEIWPPIIDRGMYTNCSGPATKGAKVQHDPNAGHPL